MRCARSRTFTLTGRRQAGDAELLDLAALAIEDGETSVDPDGEVVPASLDTTAGAIVAVCRAVERLRTVEITDP